MKNTKKLKNYSINFLFYFIIYSFIHLPCIGCEDTAKNQDESPSAHTQGDQPLNMQLDSSIENCPFLNDSPGNFKKTTLSPTRTNNLFSIRICKEDMKGDLSTTITISEPFDNDLPTDSASREDDYSFEEILKSEIILTAPTAQKSKRRVKETKKTVKQNNNNSKVRELRSSADLLGSCKKGDRELLKATFLRRINEEHMSATNDINHPNGLGVTINDTGDNKSKKRY